MIVNIPKIRIKSEIISYKYLSIKFVFLLSVIYKITNQMLFFFSHNFMSRNEIQHFHGILKNLLSCTLGQ